MDLQAEGFPVVETSTLTEEGVIKVKTEVSASSQAGVDPFTLLLFRAVSRGEGFLAGVANTEHGGDLGRRHAGIPAEPSSHPPHGTWGFARYSHPPGQVVCAFGLLLLLLASVSTGAVLRSFSWNQFRSGRKRVMVGTARGISC